jgi:hypothetical protein
MNPCTAFARALKIAGSGPVGDEGKPLGWIGKDALPVTRAQGEWQRVQGGVKRNFELRG